MSTYNSQVGGATGVTKLERAKFGPGMLLQHGDLELINCYTQQLSRLLFRSMLGSGVLCGLRVNAEIVCEKIRITVDPGVAIACSGDPVHVPQFENLSWKEGYKPSLEDQLWVVLCGNVKSSALRNSVCSEDDIEPSAIPTRERIGYDLRIVRKREGAWGFPEDSPDHAKSYPGDCGCACEDDCECNCVLLARLTFQKGQDGKMTAVVDHRVRRFIRPVLMSDPLADSIGKVGKGGESPAPNTKSLVQAFARHLEENPDVVPLYEQLQDPGLTAEKRSELFASVFRNEPGSPKGNAAGNSETGTAQAEETGPADVPEEEDDAEAPAPEVGPAPPGQGTGGTEGGAAPAAGDPKKSSKDKKPPKKGGGGS